MEGVGESGVVKVIGQTLDERLAAGNGAGLPAIECGPVVGLAGRLLTGVEGSAQSVGAVLGQCIGEGSVSHGTHRSLLATNPHWASER